MSTFTPFVRPWWLLAAVLLLALTVLLSGAGPTRAQSAAPAATGVAVSSDAGSDTTYALGEIIRVTVTFSEAVGVTGAPRLTIDMDPAAWGAKWAGYESGSGTASLVFAHTVVEPNYSTQGIAVLENSLALNGGTIQSASSQTDAGLSHSGLGHDPEHKVNWQLSPPAPAVTGVAVSSTPGADQTYALDETIRVTLTFTQAVNVSGAPRLTIDMDPAAWGAKRASYESGSGTARLTFAHTVVDPNYSTQGIAVLENTLELNGGAIRSALSNTDAALSHSGLGHDADHKVDWQVIREQEPTHVDIELDEPEKAANLDALDCTISLQAASNYTRAINGTWSHARSNSDFDCEKGGIVYRLRESGNQNWDEYYVGADGPDPAATIEKAFHYGALEPGHKYDVQIVTMDASWTSSTGDDSRWCRGRNAPDASDRWSWCSYSAIVQVIVVLDPDDPQNDNAPSQLRLETDANYGMYVRWAAPENTGSKTLTGYVLEHTKQGVATEIDVGNATSKRLQTLSADTENPYTIRVAAKYTDGTRSWSPKSEPVKLFYNPLRTWFVDNTPNLNRDIGRVFTMVDSNREGASAVCRINGGEINCPPLTLVSLDVFAGGLYWIDSQGTKTSAPRPQVTNIRLTHGGSNYVRSSPPAVTVTGGGCTGVTAVAVVNSASTNLSAIRVTNGGSGCTSDPTVTIAAPAGTGSRATAVATRTTELEARIAQSDRASSDYHRPNPLRRVWVSGGNGKLYVGWSPAPSSQKSLRTGWPGSTPRTLRFIGYLIEYRKQNTDTTWGAWAELRTGDVTSLTIGNGNAISSIAVASGGTGYTGAPTVSFSGGGGRGAEAVAVIGGGAVTSVVVTRSGTGYTSAPTVSFSGGGGSGAAATATMNTLDNGKYQVRVVMNTDNGDTDDATDHWGNRGQPVEVTLATGNTSDGEVKGIEVIQLHQGLKVRWARWDGTGIKPYGYRVRYREHGTDEWTLHNPGNGEINGRMSWGVNNTLIPLDFVVMRCGGSGCTHAREVTIGGLTTGTQYEISIQPLTANGEGGWKRASRVYEAR